MTWRAAAPLSIECIWATWPGVNRCSPRLQLIAATSVPETARRSPASMSAVAFAALSRTVAGISTTRMTAAGATACTISVSSASSMVARQGEAEPTRLATTWRRAAGRRNVLSNLARSWRMSVAPVAEVPGPGTGSKTVTVSPRPTLSSKGWMPYATRN